MRLDNERESDNVEDMRGASGSGGIGGRTIGIGATVVVLVASYFLGVDPSVLLDMVSGGSGPTQTQVSQGPAPRPPATPGTGSPRWRAVAITISSSSSENCPLSTVSCTL
jgi:predicted metalloprotease